MNPDLESRIKALEDWRKAREVQQMVLPLDQISQDVLAEYFVPEDSILGDTRKYTRLFLGYDGQPVNFSFSNAINPIRVVFSGFAINGVTLYNLTGTLAEGATSATLASAWAGSTGSLSVFFQNGDQRTVSFTNGSTSISWTGGLLQNTTGVAIYVLGSVSKRALITSEILIGRSFAINDPNPNVLSVANNNDLETFQFSQITSAVTTDSATPANTRIATSPIHTFYVNDETGNKIAIQLDSYSDNALNFSGSIADNWILTCSMIFVEYQQGKKRT